MDLGESPASPPASGLSPPQPWGGRPTLQLPAPQNLSRGLVNVAAKLTHNKDVRDLFVDLVEKVRGGPALYPPGPPIACHCPWVPGDCRLHPQFVEPCRSDHWPLNDVRLFLHQYSASAHSLDGFR